MSDDLLKALKNSVYLAFDDGTNDYTTALKAAEHIEELETMEDALKELLVQRDVRIEELVEWHDSLEAKLSRAMRALRFIGCEDNAEGHLARTALAELTKERSDEKGEKE
mgnify:CR=1 FL=1